MAQRRADVVYFPKRPRSVRRATAETPAEPSYTRTLEFRPDFATDDERPTEPLVALPEAVRDEVAALRGSTRKRTRSRETPASARPRPDKAPKAEPKKGDKPAKKDRKRRITLEIDTDPALRYHVQKLDELLRAPSPTEPLRSMSRHELAEMSLFGHQLFETGRLDEARVVFEGLVGLDLADAFPHTMLGTVYLAMGRTDRAAALFEAALGLDPEDLAARVYQAELRLSLGEVRPAVRALEAVVAQGPAEDPFVNRAARLLEIAGQGGRRR
jgi:predicted Zn-dependent protease